MAAEPRRTALLLAAAAAALLLRGAAGPGRPWRRQPRCHPGRPGAASDSHRPGPGRLGQAPASESARHTYLLGKCHESCVNVPPWSKRAVVVEPGPGRLVH